MPEAPKPAGQPAATSQDAGSPRTSAELLALADQLEARAREAARREYDRVLDEGMVEVRQIRDAAAVVERLEGMTRARDANAEAGGGAAVAIRTAPSTPGLNSPLPSESQSGITYSMNSTQIDSGPKKRRTGPPLKSKGPAAKVARTLGVSLAELADMASVNVHSLRTWDQRDQLPAEVQGKLADLVRAHEKQAKRSR
jgi:hypothetical protein